jgi:hypothetical protein
MTTTTKKEYLMLLWQRYSKANRTEKSRILDEVCSNLSCHRKSAIRTLHRAPKPKRKPKKPRLPTNLIYSQKVLWVIEHLWCLTEYPCGVILKACIPLWLPFLKKRLSIDTETREKLFQISPSTIDRMLRDKKRKLKTKIYGKTKPGKLLRSQIPIRTCSSKISEPGYIELDLVSHSGNSASGEYIHTLNAVDIALTWVSRRAVLGKGEVGVQKAVDEIKREMPCGLKSIDFDNGSEFINLHLLRYCDKQHIAYTRSRPYKKDDQAHIEQKNSTHVRRLFGRIRLDKLEVLDLMNDLYQNELFLFHNFFKPCLKLEKKFFIGSKMKRKFQKPMTPYARLLLSKNVSKEVKCKMTDLFDTLNPMELKKQIDLKMKNIFYAQYQKNETA